MTGRPARRGGPAAGAGPGGSRGTRRWRLVRARSDAVPPSARRFMARARRRRLRAALPWAVAAGVLALAGLLVWVVYGTAVLGVRSVRVAGTELLDPLDVTVAAAVPDRVPLARVDLDAVRTRVEALPPVDRAVVSRDWPGTVVVEVVERSAVAAVPDGKRFALIDDEGVPFRTVDRRPAELPVLRVAAPGPDDVHTRSGLRVLASLTDELRERLVVVSVAKPAQIRLELRGQRLIVWGDATENETKAKVATALLSQEGRTIDVSAPDVVTIR